MVGTTLLLFIVALALVFCRLLPAEIEKKWMWVAVISLNLLLLLDSHSTWLLIQRYGYAVEGNEIPRMMFERFGFETPFVIKMLFTALSFVVLIGKTTKPAMAVLVSMDVIFIIIVVISYSIFFLQ